ncbi:MAG: tetratricopeptide repeat protein [Bacteroidales bacterium]|nr:tetratricopeptide repeat protein [Bacteroidales bacterium]
MTLKTRPRLNSTVSFLMSLLRHIIVFLLLTSGAQELFSQIETRSDIEQQDNKRNLQRLGIQYYQNHEYEKSLEIFKGLYDKEPNHTNYTYSLYSMLELRDFREAEKLAKRHSRRNPQLRYKVDLGFVYMRASEPEKAHRAFEDVINNLPARVHEVKQIANAFYTRGQVEYAIRAYQQGKILMQGDYTFDIELATMYERNGNYHEMVETYLDHLAGFPEARADIQNRLQTAMARDIEHILPGILKESMLARYQESPEEVSLNELLLWLSIQQKDFSFAFIQARALDRRFKEDGYMVLNVAELALVNKDFDAALEAYEYILDKGKDAPLYLNGLIGFLETRYQQISHNIRIEDDELQELESAYEEAIAEFGVHRETMQLLRDLAHIQAFHLDKENDAIHNLLMAIAIPGPESISRAKCKIELADIYLFQGEVWEATLLYSQVDKTFKNEPIGHLAKLKNARLTYYIGEFGWAKAQLDVLKAATSKLIANDALELSLLIADNIEADSSYAGLRLYAKAELFLYQNKFDEAYITLDSIELLAGWHPLFDEVLFRKAEIRISQSEYHEADSLLQQIAIAYPGDILGDDALYRRAQLHEEVFNDREKAMELYQELLTQYPGSIYTVEARRKFRGLRGDAI